MADEPSQGEPTTPRERRRSRAPSKNAGEGLATTWRRYKVHLIILLLTVGIAGAMAVNASQTADCPGHWHSTMDVYVNGARVGYNHPKYDLSTAVQYGGDMGLSMHMHQGQNDYQWHWEPTGGAKCTDFRKALPLVDTKMSDDEVVLSGAHEQLGLAGTFPVDAQHPLRAFHRINDGAWAETSPASLLNRQAHGGERMVFVYGNDTASAIDGYKAKADGNRLDGSSTPTVSYVPVVGVSIMGLVALGVWHALARKA